MVLENRLVIAVLTNEENFEEAKAANADISWK